MTAPHEATGDSEQRPARPEAEWERKRWLARIFGDVLPETTRDEQDDPSTAERGSEAWLKAQVPPHHGS